MRVVFRDERLALVVSDPRKTRLPIAVIKAARDKLEFLRNAEDERDLRAWKSLCYEKLSGNREGQRSIRLNKQWRLVFTLDSTTSPPTIRVLEIEDYHQ